MLGKKAAQLFSNKEKLISFNLIEKDTRVLMTKLRLSLMNIRRLLIRKMELENKLQELNHSELIKN